MVDVTSYDFIDPATGIKYVRVATQSVDASGNAITDSSGNPAGNIITANGGNFTPSSVGSSSFTMDNTNVHSETIASGVTKLQVVNTGATTEAIYIAYGTTEALAKAALAWATTIATNGHYIPSPADAPQIDPVLNVPSAYMGGAYAVGNAVAGDTQVVVVSQGV